VDSIVLTYPERFSSASKIAKRISSDFSNEFDKVRAVYTWITNNIVYNPNEYGKYNFEYSTKREFEKKENKLEKKLSSRTISKGKAVCEGYSTLFTAICDNLNIKSKVVTGSSKIVVKDIGKRYYSDHAWNIVLIENQEYLIDATWGAGNYNNRFEKKVDYFYFLTDPNLFIKKHYPDYYENAVLIEKIEKKDFLNGPLIYNYDFKLINPTSGIIRKSEVDKIKFTFSSNKNVSSISFDIDRENHQVTEFENNENLEFEIDLSELKRERKLILYFDYEPIIAFKLE
jgi:transglutaminase/protease-like cytokinesis protein 3